MTAMLRRVETAALAACALVVVIAPPAHADQLCATVTFYNFDPPAMAELCVPIPDDI